MNKIFLAALASMMLFACNKDDANSPESPDDIKNPAYAQVSFSFAGPNSTKATPNPGQYGDGEEDGKDNENSMTDAIILGYKTDGSIGFLEYMVRADFTPTTGPQVVYTSKSFKVPSGDYNIYVVVNPVAPTGETYKASEEYKTRDNFEAMVYKWDTNFPTSTTDKFLMSSARGAASVSADPTKHTSASPLLVSGIEVERIVAKITYTAVKEGNKYELKENTTKVADITFIKYDLVNLRNDSYLLKRVSPLDETEPSEDNAVIGGLEIPSGKPNVANGKALNYVIENNFFNKPTTGIINRDSIGEFYEKYYSYIGTTTFTGLPNKADGETILTYTLENTMLKDAQLNGYSTGIVFKAQVAPDQEAWSGTAKVAIRKDGTFFKYNNLLFNNLKDLATVTGFAKLNKYKDGSIEEDGTETIENLKDLLKDLGIDIFEGGYCYYHYWIRHANNNNNSVMDKMEFAIVRNNIYKLSINSVNKIGKVTPDIDPEDPDEDGDAFLKVEVKILPWVVRTNAIDF